MVKIITTEEIIEKAKEKHKKEDGT